MTRGFVASSVRLSGTTSRAQILWHLRGEPALASIYADTNRASTGAWSLLRGGITYATPELLPERGTMLIKGGSTDADGWVVIAADFHGIAGHPDAAGLDQHVPGLWSEGVQALPLRSAEGRPGLAA
jgi:hypothetical protein